VDNSGNVSDDASYNEDFAFNAPAVIDEDDQVEYDELG
jgi:hypothetical protein